jgi:hypothetical protein
MRDKVRELTHNFEMEYDGHYYEIEATYAVTRDIQSTERGDRVLEDINPTGFLVYNGNAQLLVTDANLTDAIWRECDRYADVAK